MNKNREPLKFWSYYFLTINTVVVFGFIMIYNIFYKIGSVDLNDDDGI